MYIITRLVLWLVHIYIYTTPSPKGIVYFVSLFNTAYSILHQLSLGARHYYMYHRFACVILRKTTTGLIELKENLANVSLNPVAIEIAMCLVCTRGFSSFFAQIISYFIIHFEKGPDYSRYT